MATITKTSINGYELQEGVNTFEVIARSEGLSNSTDSNDLLLNHTENTPLEYTLDSSGDFYVVTGRGENEDFEIEIAAEYNGLPVEVIKGWAFAEDASIGRIHIPSSIKKIEDYAFGACANLTEVVIAEDSQLEQIGEFAFAYCEKLTTISFPPSLRYIGEEAFGNTALNIRLESGNAESPTSLSSVTYIGAGAFTNSSISGDYGTPAGMEYLGNGAFAYTNLESIWISSLLGEKHAKYPRMICQGCTRLKYVLSMDCSEIEEYAFDGCTSLAQINIGSSCTKIGPYAFRGCNQLPKEAPNTPFSFSDRYGWMRYEANVVHDYIPAKFEGVNVRHLLIDSVESKYEWRKVDQMITPWITWDGPNLKIRDATGWATSYDIYVNGELVETVQADKTKEPVVITKGTLIAFNSSILDTTETPTIYFDIYRGADATHASAFKGMYCSTEFGNVGLKYIHQSSNTELDVYDPINNIWADESYATIVVVETVEVSAEFYAWLVENATVTPNAVSQ